MVDPMVNEPMPAFASAVAVLRDRSMLVMPGQTVRTGWIDIDLIVLGCRDRMAVGDVAEKWRELLQRETCAAWPPPRGHWRSEGADPQGRFVVEDGRHEFVAALMHGRRQLFVAWLEMPRAPEGDNRRAEDDGA